MVDPLEIEESVVHPAQEEKQRSPLDNLPQKLGLRFALIEPLPNRIREHHAHDEQEQREDHVVEVDALPFHMLRKVGGDPTYYWMVNLPGDRVDELRATDDPEHIEPSEGIYRKDAIGRGWWIPRA